MSWITDAGVIMIAAGSADVSRIVLPGSRANHVGGAPVFGPSAAVRGRIPIVVMPAISYPLMDVTPHIIKAKRIWLKATRLLGLGRIVIVIESLAVGSAGLELVAPPVPCLGARAGGVLPFGLGGQSVVLSCRRIE